MGWEMVCSFSFLIEVLNSLEQGLKETTWFLPPVGGFCCLSGWEQSGCTMPLGMHFCFSRLVLIFLPPSVYIPYLLLTKQRKLREGPEKY